jgi:dienelactone hydrolase
MGRFLVVAMSVMMMTASTFAAVQTKSVTYKDGDTELQGYLAWDDAVQGKRPGVLIVHEWWGLTEYPKMRAEKLAAMGYVAFALDMYGKGKIAQNPKEAGEWAGHMRGDIEQWRKRAMVGLEQLKQAEHVDTAKLAAIGYCFGGSTVIQMGLAGADLKGVVSFHGAIPSVTSDDFKKDKAKILICHGGADSFVPMENVQNFEKAAKQASVDCRVIVYEGATHSWTNPKADEFGAKFGMPVKYHAENDAKSWADMKKFFDDVLK